MKSATAALESAFSNFVRADNTLALTLAGKKVYSMVAPQGSPFPYLVLGSNFESDITFFSNRGGNIGTLDIHIWSQQYRSKKEILDIYSAIKDGLAKDPLVLPDHTLVKARIDLITILSDPGDDEVGKLNHGVLKLDSLAIVNG